MPYSRTLSLEQALQKARHYCGYQERSHSEVQDKLYSFGLRKKDVETALAILIEENYLNEERFAVAFAGGKFRMKQWGRSKIRYELKQKQVSDYCIKKALASIDADDYEKTFRALVAKKLAELKSEKNIFTKKKKLQNYLIGKGYEFELVSGCVNDI